MRASRKALALVAVLGSWPLAAVAEIVVFTHGSYLKVTAYEVEGDKVRLDLKGGGALAVPLLQVERILADEISEEGAVEPEPPPAFAVRFDPSQTIPDLPYAELIRGTAERHGLNPSLIAAVVRVESAFDAAAVSIRGAQGLMQLMPATARRFGLGEGEVFEPARNLDAGTRYLRWLVDRFGGNLPSALAAYNSGEGTVDRYHGVPPYRETHDFLRRIYADLGLPETELPASR